MFQPGAFLAGASFFSKKSYRTTRICFVHVYCILQRKFWTGVRHIDANWKYSMTQVGLFFGGWAKVQEYAKKVRINGFCGHRLGKGFCDPFPHNKKGYILTPDTNCCCPRFMVQALTIERGDKYIYIYIYTHIFIWRVAGIHESSQVCYAELCGKKPCRPKQMKGTSQL